LPHLDVDANELALIYRARGMQPPEAEEHARTVLATLHLDAVAPESAGVDSHEAVGSAWRAAISSFGFFASGALVPILPYLFGASGLTAVITASALVGIALLGTGAVVGLLSGASPLKRALRQLAIGYGAAAVTYLLGSAFSSTVG
jgi:vacuolar iron transporter family protein